MKLTRRADALMLHGDLGGALELHEASAQIWSSHDTRYFQAPCARNAPR